MTPTGRPPVDWVVADPATLSLATLPWAKHIDPRFSRITYVVMRFRVFGIYETLEGTYHLLENAFRSDYDKRDIDGLTLLAKLFEYAERGELQIGHTVLEDPGYCNG